VADFDVPEYKNNSHWVLPDGGAAEDSNYVCYYDAASLYPSSGKTKFVFFGGRAALFGSNPNPPSPQGTAGPLRGPVPAL
jgi:hypothetical protein